MLLHPSIHLGFHHPGSKRPCGCRHPHPPCCLHPLLPPCKVRRGWGKAGTRVSHDFICSCSHIKVTLTSRSRSYSYSQAGGAHKDSAHSHASLKRTCQLLSQSHANTYTKAKDPRGSRVHTKLRLTLSIPILLWLVLAIVSYCWLLLAVARC